MSLTGNLRINGDRLWDSLMEMAKIGPGLRGGNNRQTLTDEDGEGRRLFQSWCEKAGMTMSGMTPWATCFSRVKELTRMRCRSMSAATSIHSRRAENLRSRCVGGSWRTGTDPHAQRS